MQNILKRCVTIWWNTYYFFIVRLNNNKKENRPYTWFLYTLFASIDFVLVVTKFITSWLSPHICNILILHRDEFIWMFRQLSGLLFRVTVTVKLTVREWKKCSLFTNVDFCNLLKERKKSHYTTRKISGTGNINSINKSAMVFLNPFMHIAYC